MNEGKRRRAEEIVVTLGTEREEEWDGGVEGLEDIQMDGWRMDWRMDACTYIGTCEICRYV